MAVTFWVTILTLLRRHSVGALKLNQGFYVYMLIGFLLLVRVLSFSEVNLLGFYFYFEASLIPMFLIILGYGYQPERLQAGLYLIYYTLGASLPFLIFLNLYYSKRGGLGLALGLEIDLGGFRIFF